MLMHVIVRGGCTNTVRESALKVDSVRKISLTAYRGMEPASGLRLNFGPNALPTEISRPLDLDFVASTSIDCIFRHKVSCPDCESDL